MHAENLLRVGSRFSAISQLLLTLLSGSRATIGLEMGGSISKLRLMCCEKGEC